MPAIQAWRPEFNSQKTHKGGRKELTICSHTYSMHIYTINKTKPSSTKPECFLGSAYRFMRHNCDNTLVTELLGHSPLYEGLCVLPMFSWRSALHSFWILLVDALRFLLKLLMPKPWLLAKKKHLSGFNNILDSTKSLHIFNFYKHFKVGRRDAV